MTFIIIILGILATCAVLIARAVQQLRAQDLAAQYVFAQFAVHLGEIIEEQERWILPTRGRMRDRALGEALMRRRISCL